MHNMGKKPFQHAIVYGWYSKFSEGRKEVLILLYACVQPTAVCEMNVLN
jgi:hypothetical protein